MIEEGKKKTVIVSNLPFGRNVDFVDGTLEETLNVLKPLAGTHAFISGVPVADTMKKCGYENVNAVALDRHGLTFATVSFGGGGKNIAISNDDVYFTVDEALVFDEMQRNRKNKNSEKEK